MSTFLDQLRARAQAQGVHRPVQVSPPEELPQPSVAGDSGFRPPELTPAPTAGVSFLAGMQARKDSAGWIAPDTETMRILSLPEVAASEVDLTPSLRLPAGRVSLRPVQNTALHAIGHNRGLLGVIGVGHGKSLIALLAGTVLGSKLALVLAPASTVGQLRKTLAEARAHFRIPPTHVLSYATLSRPEGTRLLEDYMEGVADRDVVLVADEAHRLKRHESARTKRVIRFLTKHPEIAFVALSGTMTAKSLKDFAHLAAMALKNNSPVPRDRAHLEAWSECMDVKGRPGPQHWSIVSPLFERYTQGASPFQYSGETRSKLVRQAFRERLRTSPGVITTQEGSIGCSLRLRAVQVPLPADVELALQRVIDSGDDPAGEPIPDDATAWRVKRHLCQGFYYRWVWPDGIEDKVWLDARRAWGRHVRAELEQRAAEGYDSPLLVSNRVERELAQGRSAPLHRAWQRWKGEKDKPAPPVEAVWVNPFLVQHAVAWVRAQKKSVILWYDSLAVEEALRATGLPVYGAGAEIPSKAHDCAMSIQAHGVGKNLQPWSTMLVMSPPSSGHTWEQLLGRLHRQGQEADEVECYIYQHAPAFVDAMIQAVEDGRYIQDTTGNAQKLCYADFESFVF